MPQNNKEIGAQGENRTLAFLRERGYQVIDLNVRPEGGMARGELDIIAWHAETLIFIEVKTRRTQRGNQGSPAEAITLAKRRQLTKLALAYLAKHDLDDVPCRFDVVEVIEPRIGVPRFFLITNAFDAL